MDAMAKSSMDMTRIMARRQKHDGLARRADLHLNLGQEEKAMEPLAMMEEDDRNPTIVEATIRSDKMPPRATRCFEVLKCHFSSLVFPFLNGEWLVAD